MSIMYKTLGAGVGAVALLSAGVALAQTAPTFTFTPSASVAPGQVVVVGLFSVSGESGTQVTSVPLTVTATNGGAPQYLTNCTLTDSADNNLGNTFNPVAAPVTYVFSTPYQVGPNAVSLTMRCDVAGITPIGAAFQVTAGTPIFTGTTTTPQTNAELRVGFAASNSVPSGTTNVAVSVIGLDATDSNAPITVTSLPVSITPNGGASAADIHSCTLRNTTNLRLSLPATQTESGTMRTFALTNPLVVTAGTQVNLALVCSVDSTVPTGSSFAIAVDPSQVGATGNGVVVTPAAALDSNGLTLPTSGVVNVVSPTGDDVPVIPGVPNTGSGGGASAAILLLSLAGLLAVGGSYYFSRLLRI